MKKLLITFALIYAANAVSAQSIYKSKDALITFFSKSPLEDISAKNNQVTSILNINTGEIVFFVPIRGFKFEKDLMETHFNEKYLESDKYPKASLKAKINEKIDYSKDGEYNVTATGTMNIHGVDKNITEKGKLTIKGGEIHLECNFVAITADYKIEIPKLVIKNIAEKIDVKVIANYIVYKK
jgi:hypothetical protein